MREKETTPGDVSFKHTNHMFLLIVFKIVYKQALFSESIVPETNFKLASISKNRNRIFDVIIQVSYLT